ncbi:MAG TPA: hypothetical protein VNO81_11495 [Candidatus Nitrosotenuis sp.]|nr:hypothetical protein [Candidatus Nitrosotenuis sp.]
MSLIVEERPFDLVPLDLGAILDRSFELFRGNFGLLLGVAGVVYIPLGLLQMAGAAMGPEIAFVTNVVVALLLFVFSIVAGGALVVAVSRRYLGQQATLASAYQALRPVLGPLLVTQILVGLLAILVMGLAAAPGAVALMLGVGLAASGQAPGAPLAALGGLYLLLVLGALSFAIATATLFVGQVVVLERVFFFEALARVGRLLARGQWARALMMVGVVGTLGFALSMIPAALLVLVADFSPRLYEALHAAWGGLANTFLVPFSMIAYTLFYYDVRVRQEALDLRHKIEELDPAGLRCACGQKLLPGAAFCSACGGTASANGGPDPGPTLLAGASIPPGSPRPGASV